MNKSVFFFLLPLLAINSCKKDTRIKVINDDKDVVLELKPSYNNPRNSEGDFVTLKDGRLLFVYTHHTGSSWADDSAAYLAGRYSTDSGKTWHKEERVIVGQEGKMNVMSASLLRLKNGKIALFYMVKNSPVDCKPYMRISDDEGETWGTPINCITNRNGFFVVNNNRVIQLKNGRIILPVALHKEEDEPNRNYLIGKIFTYYSDDNGQTWKSGNMLQNPKNILIQEPGVIELNDGRLLMLLRTNQKRQFYTYSNDHGKSWGVMAPTTLKSPVSPASMARIPSTGDIMVVWNNNDDETPSTRSHRTPFNLAISKDEGKTWGNIKTIEDNKDGMYCYTAIHFIGDHVLLGHCAGLMSRTQGLCVTHITRLSTRWIYN